MNKFAFNSLRLVQTRSFVHRIWLFSLLLLLFFIVILFLPWQQTITGEGTVIAYNPSERVQEISAPIDGFIENFYVTEDEHVQKGTKLFEMIDPDKEYKSCVYKMKSDFEQQNQNTENELITLKKNKSSLFEQKQIRTELYDKRYAQAKEQLKMLHVRYTAQQKSFEVDKKQFLRIEQLYNQKIESKRSYEQAEKSYIQSKAQMEKLQIDIKVQKRNLTIIQEEKKQFLEEIETQIRTLENTMLTVQTRLNILKRDYEQHLSTIARYETSMVLSEKEGYVMRILQNDKNTYVKKGVPVMRFSPEVTTRSVLLKISDFNMPLIQEGLSVRIRFHGWPVLHIPGWPAIKFGTFGGIIKKIDPILHEPGIYYAYIVEDPNEPWPPQKRLRVGTNTTVWVALNKVSIWYELWRLMNAFPPQMVTQEKK